MFEVQYGSKFFKVYGVRDNGDKVPPDFLIYINSHWAWFSSIKFYPTEY